jgi:protein-S-isoprenylcysteine O-methyltransferase Ste14
MTYIIIGIAAFLVFHLLDVASMKQHSWAKPVTWVAGSLAFIYAMVMASVTGDKFALHAALSAAGWLLLAAGTALVLYSLFVNLPFKKTYIKPGIGDELVTGGLYSLVRHPGVYGLVMVMAAAALISRSQLMFSAAIVWTVTDIAVVTVQDYLFFGRMFPGYAEYRKTTPMLLPNRNTFTRLVNMLKPERIQTRRANPVSQIGELFKKGDYAEVWQRCCGFIDLSLEEFMRIQKRLLMEQIDLYRKCEMGKRIMVGGTPRNLEEFREMVPLTTYDDYSPYLLKRRMDILPRKPILWQCTSGKTGEYQHRWVPVTARLVDEMESLVYALMFFSSCQQRGEINVREGDRVLYGMAPPPYATGTMTRAFPSEMFRLLPDIEDAERLPFEERMKTGFEMAMVQGLDGCLAMSSVAEAIGRRFSQHGRSESGLWRRLRKNPGMVVRLAKGMMKAKLAGRPILPRDLWNLKYLVTFGIDGAVFRERIREMWGRYALDFHGCTEAMIIAMQTWDYQGMTFVPNLNFFEFIPEADALRMREDESFTPRTLLMDELVPGNYELVITSLHGGPFMRYRLGHLVKIHSLRNEKLNIDIPQMSFIARIDDQIDLAGFTRLGEKVIWQAIENTKLQYTDWVVRKEVNGKPVLHIYLELKGSSRYEVDVKVGRMIHDQLKKLDSPYADLETFTGIYPLKVTLLPADAFKNLKRHLQQAGGDLASHKVLHINPNDEILAILTDTLEVAPVVSPARQPAEA